jgi:hypothetical protein
MKSELLTQNEIKLQGFSLLQKNLGISGFIRFMQQFDLGIGNYTKNKQINLKNKSVKDIVKDIKNK